MPTFSQHGNAINIKIFVYIYGHNLKVLIEKKFNWRKIKTICKLFSFVNLLNKVFIYVYLKIFSN